jgi:uncharacterized small protein (DUF1192 family)
MAECHIAFCGGVKRGSVSWHAQAGGISIGTRRCAHAEVAAKSIDRLIAQSPARQAACDNSTIEERESMPIEDDDRPRKKVSHEIGQDLSLLSVEELTERIALLTAEIERLQAALTRKRASKAAADGFFKS